LETGIFTPSGSWIMENTRVLLVHQEGKFRDSIAGLLGQWDIVHEEAESGEQCLAILEKRPVDVVVSYAQLPDMDGIQLLRAIKGKNPHTEVILISEHATTEDCVEAMKSGAFDYLNRPSAITHVLGRIMQAKNKILREKEERGESELRYQALLQSVTDYVIGINRNYQVIMANDLFKTEFGMHAGDLCYRVWKNREEKCEDCLVDKSFEDGQIHSSEEMVVMKDGGAAEMLVRSTPVENERGEIIYVLETATNITEKRRLQNQMHQLTGDLEEIMGERLRHLQHSEEKYRTIFERSRNAVLLTDRNWRIVEINRAGVELLGYHSQGEILSMKWVFELFENLEDLKQFREKVSREGYVTEFETRLLRKKGRGFDARISCSVTVDVNGQIIGHVLNVLDITRRKQAQHQIQRQNIRLTTLNAISQTVSSSLELNEVLQRTIDKILEVLESDSVRIYLLDEKREALHLVAHKGLTAESIEKSHMRTRNAGEGILGETVLTGEIRVIDNLQRIDNPYVDSLLKEGLKSTIYIPLVSKGKTVGVMCVSNHSSVRASEDYVEFLAAIGNQIGVAVDNANLYESVTRAYQELKEAQEQVIRTEKLASLGKLAATIAHEINNPIAAVLNYVRLMKKLADRDRFKPDRLRDISRYLDTMESETARCGEIVRNLLAFSRRSRIMIEPQPIEEVIERTSVLIAHELRIHEIQLVREIEEDLPKVLCDFKQVQQALLNLMSNASEAMSKGGTLTVSAKRSQRNGFLEVGVSDTGTGIAEEDMKNIFEPFFTTKEEGKGVGLGLSVVYGIITRHNGSIEVESTPGKGSTFRVFLPIA